MRVLKIAAALLICILGSGLARAQVDPRHGAELALDFCARCHNVEPNGPFKLFPPSFAAIAVYRSEDHIRAQIIFPPLHTNMPNLGHILTPSNVEDLVAYIRSLEKLSIDQK